MGVVLTPIVKSGGQLVTKLNNAFKVSLLEAIQEKRVILDARELIPARPATSVTGLTIGKRYIEFMKLSYTGKVARTMTRGKSLPRVVFDKKTDMRKLVFLGTEIEIDRDMKDAITGGDALPTDITGAAVRVIMEDDNDLLMNGDTALGLEGLATVTGSRTYVVGNGVAGTPEFETKTAVEIADDVVGAVAEFEKEGKFKAEVLAFHPSIYYHLDTKRFGTNGEGRTVLEDLNSRGYNVQKKYSLKDSSGAPGMAILDKKPENYFFIEVTAPQNTDNYKEKTSEISIYEEKITEVIAPQPEAIMFIEGVI